MNAKPTLLLAVIGLLIGIATANAQSARAAQKIPPLTDPSHTQTIPAAPATADKEARFKSLNDKVDSLRQDPKRDLNEFAQVAKQLINEFPDRVSGYETLRTVIQLEKPDKARLLAKELTESPAPEPFKLWGKGYLHRLDSFGKPVNLQFVALDGRRIDTEELRGKVVLLDFWATFCEPCVQATPHLKDLYAKYHPEGFEIIGVSFDEDKSALNRFIKERAVPWPQYFEPIQGPDNKIAQEFGVSAIPQIMLLDKKGCLRKDGLFDPYRLEPYVFNLLAEP